VAYGDAVIAVALFKRASRLQYNCHWHWPCPVSERFRKAIASSD